MTKRRRATKSMLLVNQSQWRRQTGEVMMNGPVGGLFVSPYGYPRFRCIYASLQDLPSVMTLLAVSLFPLMVILVLDASSNLFKINRPFVRTSGVQWHNRYLQSNKTERKTKKFLSSSWPIISVKLFSIGKSSYYFLLRLLLHSNIVVRLGSGGGVWMVGWWVVDSEWWGSSSWVNDQADKNSGRENFRSVI